MCLFLKEIWFSEGNGLINRKLQNSVSAHKGNLKIPWKQRREAIDIVGMNRDDYQGSFRDAVVLEQHLKGRRKIYR